MCEIAMCSTIQDDLKHDLEFWANDNHYIDWRGIGDLSQDLSQWLTKVKASIKDPEIGLKLITAFFELDGPIMERSDDDGIIGQVFEWEAADQFWQYAGSCCRKDAVMVSLLKLLPKDRYGTRRGLFERIYENLSDVDFRNLLGRVRALSQGKEKPEVWSSSLKMLQYS